MEENEEGREGSTKKKKKKEEKKGPAPRNDKVTDFFSTTRKMERGKKGERGVIEEEEEGNIAG